MGVERVVELLSAGRQRAAGAPRPRSISSRAAQRAERAGLRLAEQLRDALPGRGVLLNLGGGNFKAQFRRADRSGARAGADPRPMRSSIAGVAAVKPLRREGGQIDCPLSELPARIASFL